LALKDAQLVIKEIHIVRDAREISMRFVRFCELQWVCCPFITLFFANSRAVAASTRPRSPTLAHK
jgi:hypothetical protein